jgi:peptide/nickel transport system substrate-binding protein
MKASGHPDGFTTNLMFSPERRPEFEQVAVYVQAYLKKIGIDVKVQKVAFDTQLAKMEKGDYGMSLMQWTTVLPDPDDIAGWLYDSSRASGGWNGSYWDNKDVQAKLLKGRSIANSEQRKALYQEVDRKGVDEAIYVFLYQLQLQFGVRENIKDLFYDPLLKIYFWSIDKQ